MTSVPVQRQPGFYPYQTWSRDRDGGVRSADQGAIAGARERRDFLPSLIGRLEELGGMVMLEHGYGSGMGYSDDDYRQAAPGVIAPAGNDQFISLAQAI